MIDAGKNKDSESLKILQRSTSFNYSGPYSIGANKWPVSMYLARGLYKVILYHVINIHYSFYNIYNMI